MDDFNTVYALLVLVMLFILLSRLDNRFGKIEKELNEIAQDPPSKQATDSWACLQVAMYIATKNPIYRDAAKEYERKYQPKSAFLHSLIQVVRRFELNI